MKKLTFLICLLLACSLCIDAQNPQFVSTDRKCRNVIIEEFTGRECGYCPDGHKIANNIVKENPGRVWAINIHSGNYAANDYPNFKTEDGDIIRSTIHNGGYPSAAVNRSTAQTLGRGEWASHTTTQMAQSAECNVAGQVVINSETRVATIAVEVYYTGNSTSNKNYLTVMMLQDNILGSQSGGSIYNPSQIVNGQYCHMHVLRDVITPTWGEEIAPTTYGTLIKKTYSYQIPQIIGSPNGVAVDLDNIIFLALVTEKEENGATRPILNVNELTITEGYDVEATAKINPANSGTVNGTGTYTYGDYATLKAVPNQGFKFFSWTKDGDVVSKSDEYTFVITEDTEIVANFVSEDSYYITTSVNPKDAGAVTGAGSYHGHETATLVAMPSEGYRFVSWTENDEVVSTDAEYSFETTSDRNLVANFTLLNYNVEASTNHEDRGEIILSYFEENFEDGKLPYGWTVYNEDLSSQSNTPNDSESWNVVDTYSNITPNDGEYFIASISEKSYYDARLYLVTPKMTIPSDSEITFSYLNPKEEKDGNSVMSRLYLYMSTSPTGPWTEIWNTRPNKSTSKWTDVNVSLKDYANQEVYFAFCNKFSGYGSWTAIDNFALLSTSAIKDEFAGNYEHGDNVILIAKAYEGYKFANWTENEQIVSTDSKYSFTITGDRELVANFVSENLCLAIASSNPNEGGSVAGIGTYEKNDTVTLSAVANTGYRFVNWTEDDVIVSEEAEYTFIITSDRLLLANFELRKYNVDADINLEDAGAITGAGSYNYGDTITMTAIANEGFKFINWTEDDTIVSEEAVFSFVITSDKVFVANFISTEDIEEQEALTLSIYPNPTKTNTEIKLGASFDRVEVYNTYGVKIAEYNNVDVVEGITRSGIYIIKVIKDNEIRNCRIIVK